MTATAIDLGPELDAICAKLGLLDKSYVSQIILEPTSATATVYRGKDGDYQGSKYIDEETGEPARDELSFSVTT